ncbi:MAG: hypothetical protein WBA01_03075 [Phormidesmis sp.]
MSKNNKNANNEMNSDKAESQDMDSQDMDSQEQLNQFLSPRYRYHGEFTPENLAFNANLKEFAQRVVLICSLETGGKVSSAEAYSDIKKLWKELKASKKNLLKKEKEE